MKKPPISRANAERLMCCCIAIFSFMAAGILMMLLGYVLANGWSPLKHGCLRASMEVGNEPLVEAGWRTIYALLGATLIASPLGVSAGIFLSEYAPDTRSTASIVDGIDSLAEVPPIVYGLFGWGALSLHWGLDASWLILLTLGLWLLPRLITVTYAAVQEVPVSFRRESLALGASRWQTTLKAVLPYAMADIVAGILEGMARVSGVAAPVIMLAASQPLPQEAPLRILPYYLYRSVIESAEIGTESQFGTALLLLTICLLLQSAAILVRSIWVSPLSTPNMGERIDG
ncbi:MAG: ABC transporter permease subunit [Firmicutes bacterium]|nr:ABC transporter permease subunit [Bacillota bacterium]